MNVVVWWLKRDLRLADNSALSGALAKAREWGCHLVALWITEPEGFSAPEFHPRRERFVSECLNELEANLRQLNIPLWIAEGHAIDIYRALTAQGLRAVFSHEETGVLWTYERDRQLKAFFRTEGIVWTEYPTNGVVRVLRDRGAWQREYQRRMASENLARPQVALPKSNFSGMIANFQGISKVRVLRWDARAESQLIRAAQSVTQVQQRGGESVAHALLDRFLAPEVHSKYIRHLSQPHEAQYFSSRLSPYLAFGCLSSRQILSKLRAMPSLSLDGRSVAAFQSRLAWRCHFIQKFENFPDMERCEQNAALTSLRPEMSRHEIELWKNGQTGFPLVDACLRSVHRSGFLNFRMRAMLMSFATHLLWRDWRQPAWDLAQAFLDFEPGIHFAQVQMQAAVTGNNQIRIYNPLKQAQENDPTCRFIKQWVPELRDVAPERILACQDLPSSYPKPIVDVQQAMAHARENLFAKFREPEVRAEARVVQEKLGSRGGRLSWRGTQAERQKRNRQTFKKNRSEKRPLVTLFDESLESEE